MSRSLWPLNCVSLVTLCYELNWVTPSPPHQISGLPGGPDSKEFAYNAGDVGSIPGSGRSPGEGHGYPLQYSCLENSMGRGAWWATLHGIQRVGYN